MDMSGDNMYMEPMDDDEDFNDEEMDSYTPMKVGEKKVLKPHDGIEKELLKEGEGFDQPEAGDEVFVHYVGTLDNGTKFDSSRDRGEPFSFTLGQGMVIKGWDVGVATMKKGEMCNLVCKPEYAYGASGSPPTIPPNSTLNFEVELLRWKSVKDLVGDGGIIKTIVEKGEGYKNPNDIDEVVVAYTAKKADGSIVKQTGEEGVTFTVFDGHFCPAMGTILKTMLLKEAVSCLVKDQYVEGVDGVGEGETMTLELKLLEIHAVEKVSGSDIMKKTLVEGEGYDRPNEGAQVGVRFTASLEDGTVFEQTPEGDEGLCRWTVDEEQQIEGLDRAVTKMKKGEKALITIAPQFAFGSEAVTKPLATVPANSTVQYTLELVEMVKAKESWSMSTEEKFEFFEKAKAEGNTLFKAGKYERALKKYSKALTCMESDHSMGDEEKAKAKKAKVPLYLNKAAVALKTKDFGEVKTSCGKALEIEFQNEKALFRRAQAHFGLGDHDLAESDLKILLEIDKDNKDAQREMRKVKQALKEQYRKEKKVFGNMFERMSKGGGDLYEAPPAHPTPPEGFVPEESMENTNQDDLNADQSTEDTHTEPASTET